MTTRRRSNQVAPVTVVYPDGQATLPPGYEAELLTLHREKSDRKRLEIIRRFSVPITIKRVLRKTTFDSKKSQFTGCSAWRYNQRLKWTKTKASWKEFTRRLEVWRDSFKQIEGNFGTGVVSYFTFLKWLFFLNLYIFLLMFVFVVIPQVVFPMTSTGQYVTAGSLANDTDTPTAQTLLADNCSANYVVSVNPTDYAQLIQDVLQGTGWMEQKVLFYGFYDAKRFPLFDIGSHIHYYNIPLAYLFVTLVVFLLSLGLMIKYTSRTMRENMVSSEDKFYKYSGLVFGGWDFSLETEKAANLKHKSLYNEIAGEIKEEIEEERRKNRSNCKKFGIYCVRFLVNIFVIGVLGGSGYLIYFTTFQSEALTEDPNYENYNSFVKLLIEYIPSLTITFLNAFVPILFKVVKLEDYSMAFEIKLTLIRTVFLRLASVIMLLVTMYLQVTCTTQRDYCNVGVAGSCPELKCWETYIGQQIYKLIFLNFLVTVLLILFVEFPRRLIVTKCSCKLAKMVGQQEFDLSKNVLDLVYTQVLCWLGLFFSPLIPAMCLVTMFVFFYMKKLTVLFNYIPASRPYRASRSNMFFMVILIIAYFGCGIFVGFVIWNIEPSHGCGPFRIYNRDLDVWTITLESFPDIAQTIIETLSSTTVFLVTLLVLIMALYFTQQLSMAYKDMVNLMKDQLVMEEKDKAFLMKQITEASGQKIKTLRQFRVSSAKHTDQRQQQVPQQQVPQQQVPQQQVPQQPIPQQQVPQYSPQPMPQAQSPGPAEYQHL